MVRGEGGTFQSATPASNSFPGPEVAPAKALSKACLDASRCGGRREMRGRPTCSTPGLAHLDRISRMMPG